MPRAETLLLGSPANLAKECCTAPPLRPLLSRSRARQGQLVCTNTSRSPHLSSGRRMATSQHDNWISSTAPRRQGLAEILAAWLYFPPLARRLLLSLPSPRAYVSLFLLQRQVVSEPFNTAVVNHRVVELPSSPAIGIWLSAASWLLPLCRGSRRYFPLTWGKDKWVVQGSPTKVADGAKYVVLRDKNAECGLNVYIVLSKVDGLSTLHTLETPAQPIQP